MPTLVQSRSLAMSLRLGLALAAALTAGCSGGDDDVADDESTTTESSSTTTATDPSASGDGQQLAFGIVEEVVLEATALADTLLQQPDVIEEPGSDEVAELRDLYTEDSEGPEAVLDRLRELDEAGQTVRAASSGVFRQMKVFESAAIDEDTVRFRICAVQDQETVDSAGNVVSRFAEVTQGTGEARRVDGNWRLYGIHRDPDTSFDIEPGSADPGTCDALYPTEDPA